MLITELALSNKKLELPNDSENKKNNFSNSSTRLKVTNSFKDTRIKSSIKDFKNVDSLNEKKNESPSLQAGLKIEEDVLLSIYGQDIFEYNKNLEEDIVKPGFINRHKFDATIRTKMVDWMIEVLYTFNSDPPTFFLAVEILDSFLSKSRLNLSGKDLHLTGICCIYIASKMEDLIPIRMSHIKKSIGHDTFSVKQIKKKEKLILETIDFNIITTSTYEFIKNYIFDLCHNNKELIESLKISEKLDNFSSICFFLSKLMCHCEEFSHFKHSLKAISCIIAAFDLLRSNSSDFHKDVENFMTQWVKIN
jgi:hypothetical protein